MSPICNDLLKPAVRLSFAILSSFEGDIKEKCWNFSKLYRLTLAFKVRTKSVQQVSRGRCKRKTSIFKIMINIAVKEIFFNDFRDV